MCVVTLVTQLTFVIIVLIVNVSNDRNPIMYTKLITFTINCLMFVCLVITYILSKCIRIKFVKIVSLLYICMTR